MELIFAGILGFGIFLVFISFIVGQQLDPVQARLQQIAVRPRTLEELELQRQIGHRTIKPIVQGLSRLVSRFYPANTARSLQIRLKRAGMETTSVEFFLGVKAFAAIIGALGISSLVNLLTSDGLMTVGGLFGGVILGFLAPDFYLNSKAGARGSQNLAHLPDALALPTIQADQLGVSMSKVLRIQSETLRTERRQRAEEKAARAPILIMLPTVGCIFPSLFIVILAPAALSALSSCGTV